MFLVNNQTTVWEELQEFILDWRSEHQKGKDKQIYIRRKENSGEGSEVRENGKWNISQARQRTEHKSGKAEDRT